MEEIKKYQFVCGNCQKEWIEYHEYEHCPYCNNSFVYKYEILKG